MDADSHQLHMKMPLCFGETPHGVSPIPKSVPTCSVYRPASSSMSRLIRPRRRSSRTPCLATVFMFLQLRLSCFFFSPRSTFSEHTPSQLRSGSLPDSNSRLASAIPFWISMYGALSPLPSRQQMWSRLYSLTSEHFRSHHMSTLSFRGICHNVTFELSESTMSTRTCIHFGIANFRQNGQPRKEEWQSRQVSEHNGTCHQATKASMPFCSRFGQAAAQRGTTNTRGPIQTQSCSGS